MADEPKQEAKQEKKADTKVSAKLDKLMGEIESLTVLELADLVKALEEKFGVTAIAAAPAAASNGAGAASNAGGEQAKEEQTVFNVVLKGDGGKKIQVLKAVRELVPTLSLLDAKKLVESLPKDVLTGVNKKDAEEAQKKLAAAGAQVELK
ncbi:MAG TPA: 50S ribosomal protein L7/L12 [Patescibacteria group bacterium]|nr:50S ribosomal protein L7/L12 [Patescibacteria group bacterium]